MNIHEYQAKGLFAAYQIPVPRGVLVSSLSEVYAAVEGVKSPISVVKAQIHAGGRGKAGGVRLARSYQDVETHAQALLGSTLVTAQTGPAGQCVKKLLIEEGVDIARELYVSFVLDRTSNAITLIASTEGGMDIEEVAARSPEKIVRLLIDPTLGYQAYQGRTLAFALGLPPETWGEWEKLLGALCRLFVEKDASQIEINPLVITRQGRLIALDAKIVFDDNALYSHPEIASLRDIDEENPLETQATQYSLNYVKLNGTIGCMVNGAGLAMATMDVIHLAGGAPANFLDVGGGASQETVKQGFHILLSDTDVKGILVNIFGGIVRCERIAHGLIEAAKEIAISVPLVVRLEGTNAKEAKALLASSSVNLGVADTLWEGAQKVVAAVGASR